MLQRLFETTNRPLATYIPIWQESESISECSTPTRSLELLEVCTLGSIDRSANRKQS